MHINKFVFIVIAWLFSNCNHSIKSDTGEHEGVEVKIFLTAYSENYELFAETDPFVAGKTVKILAHFTRLSDFKAIDSAGVLIRLATEAGEISQKLDRPTRKGIYSFEIEPSVAGSGKLFFSISTRDGVDEVVVPALTIYGTLEEAEKEAHLREPENTNAIVFTKEQSWKVGFSTALPEMQPFGPVIKTMAMVQPALNEEVIVSAKTSGMVIFPSLNLYEGQPVRAGASLFSVSGAGLAENNALVRFTEIENDYLKAKADFDRQQALADDQIIPEKELSATRNAFNNARVKYEMMVKNFSVTGQTVSSPLSGFLTHLYVRNGQYVEAGQPLAAVSKDNNLLLTADILQKYAPLAPQITDAVFRLPGEETTYTLNQLNGKILGFGRHLNPDNFMIPVHLQINNPGGFVPGGFVEVHLKTITDEMALVVPDSSLLEEQGIFFVLVQITPELFEKREVRTGASDGMFTEIRSGLDPEDRIVTKGAMLVRLAQASGALDPHAGHVH